MSATAALSRDDPAHPEAAWRERARLVAQLAAQHEAHWAEPDPADPHAPAYRVVCLHTPAGQMTWHVHLEDVALFPGDIPTRPSDFDGHTTAEKYARLALLDPAGCDHPGVAGTRCAACRAPVVFVDTVVSGPDGMPVRLPRPGELAPDGAEVADALRAVLARGVTGASLSAQLRLAAHAPELADAVEALDIARITRAVRRIRALARALDEVGRACEQAEPEPCEQP